MEKILKMNNGKVELLREELELIPEFATLFTYKYNKQPGDIEGKKRYRVTQELIYVWFMYSYASPYREYSEKERFEESLAASGFPSTFVESPELKAAIEKYKNLNESRILKLIRAAEKAVDNLRAYFETVNFTDKNQNGALINKPSEVIRAILDLDKVATGLDKLANRVKHELKEGSATRGNQEDGWIMDDAPYNTDYDTYEGSPSADDAEEEDS